MGGYTHEGPVMRWLVDCPHKGPVMLSCGVFVLFSPNKLLDNQSAPAMTHFVPVTVAIMTAAHWGLNKMAVILPTSLEWRQIERDGILNRRRFNCLYRRRSSKSSKLCVTGLCEGNPLVTLGFPSQRACNAEIVSIWSRHHVWMDFLLWKL